jgi:hypothetical protein
MMNNESLANARVITFLTQPFSIDSAGFPCRDPVIPSHTQEKGRNLENPYSLTGFSVVPFLLLHKIDVHIRSGLYFSTKKMNVMIQKSLLSKGTYQKTQVSGYLSTYVTLLTI